MSVKDLLSMSPLLSERVRLAIMTALVSAEEELDFNTLLSQLELTKGNLSSHLRKLEEGELIQVEKSFVDRKPRTTYSPTPKGIEELKEYLEMIEKLLKSTGGKK